MKKNVKKVAAILSLVSFIAYAENRIEITEEQKQALLKQSIADLEKNGYLTPDSGVEIVSMNELKFDQSKKIKSKIELKQRKALGYVKEHSDRAAYLLDFRNLIKRLQPLMSKKFKPYESHLRSHPSELKMAYTYIRVPEEVMTAYIGAAPSGTYTDNGWTGAVEYFETDFGTCVFSDNNLHVSHGAARVAKESATEEVNGKITVTDVRGDDASGYLYDVHWFSRDFIRSVECASKKFDNSYLAKTIEIAKIIDNQ